MGFKKNMNSDAPIVIGETSDESKLFRPGFCYQIEDVIYTVIRDVTQDVTASMRKVVLADGTHEIMTVESIRKDIVSYGAKRLPDVERYVERKPVAKKPEKATKKKATKKKAEKKKAVKKKVAKKEKKDD